MLNTCSIGFFSPFGEPSQLKNGNLGRIFYFFQNGGGLYELDKLVNVIHA